MEERPESIQHSGSGVQDQVSNSDFQAVVVAVLSFVTDRLTSCTFKAFLSTSMRCQGGPSERGIKKPRFDFVGVHETSAQPLPLLDIFKT